MLLKASDIRMFLDVLAEKYGPGYSDDEAVGRLQAKLSVMLEAATNRETAARHNDNKPGRV